MVVTVNNMSKETKHIGIKLAKQLQEWGCDIESEYFWNKKIDNSFSLIKGTFGDKTDVLAYSYYDIIVTHAKEFFGEYRLCDECGKKVKIPVPFRIMKCDCGRSFARNERAHEYNAKQIIGFLQHEQLENADIYIRAYTIFNPKNK